MFTPDIQKLIEWCSINSGTYNTAGLARMADVLARDFAPLGATLKRIDLPPAELVDSSGSIVQAPLGQVLQLTKRPTATRRVLLCIHYDTVFGADHPFQSVRQLDDSTLNGPGVNDAKGGLLVMLTALREFETLPEIERLGWEIILNPDEEIGSPSSGAILREAATRNHFGLLFEPALPDGSLVGARKGSGNFTVIVRGRAAHAGRDFASGRSAIVALAELIGKLDRAGREIGGGVTINCGKIEGGGAVNVVSDLAIGRFNCRVGAIDEMQRVEECIRDAAAEVGKRDGITVTLHGGFASPPKVVDARAQRLFELAIECGREQGLNLSIRSSGGTCDGNKLAAAGLPVIDTLGPVGGEIHSDREFTKTPTLAERARLTLSLLRRLAALP